MKRQIDCDFSIGPAETERVRKALNRLTSVSADSLLEEMARFLPTVTGRSLQDPSCLGITLADLSLPPETPAPPGWRPMSQPTLSRFKSGSGGSNISNRNANTLYIFILNKYNYLLELESESEGVKSREPFTRAVRSIFGHDDNWGRDIAIDYAGRFVVYRPFFLDPSKALVGVLNIGEAAGAEGVSSPLDVSLTYSYPRGDNTVTETHRGKIAKHGSSATIILGNEKKQHFILYIDRSDDQNPKNELAGILIANASQGLKHSASAWPFYALRTTPGLEVAMGVVDLATVSQDVQRELGRGAVHWDPAQQQGTPKP